MINQHVLISASAGSGKTYRLVHQFLGILHNALIAEQAERQPDVIERTVAATFTRAAAGEIIDRTLKRIATAASDDDGRTNLCEALGLVTLSQEDCWKMLKAILTGLHKLRICTLDSFFVRTAQAYSTELGLPDRWTILNDSNDYAASLEAVDQLLDAKSADPNEFDRMVELIVMLHRNRYPVQIREKVVAQLRSAQGALTAGPHAAWEAIVPVEADLMDADALAEYVTQLWPKLMPMIPHTKAGNLNVNWLKAATKLVLEAKAGQWDSLVCSGLICAMAKTPPTYHKVELDDFMIDCLQPLRRHAMATIMGRLLDRNRSTRELLGEFVERYANVKANYATYRFDDFTAMLLDAEVLHDLADFYHRLDGPIDHILLDEFQDTSIPQWKLIKPLVEEIMSGDAAQGCRRSFFCVGDVKQTLYGWRDAEPQLLDELSNEWPQISRMDLVHNRRSAPVIIDTINTIFASLANNASLVPADDEHSYLGVAAAIWSNWFQSHQTLPENQNETGYARLLSCAEGENAADRQHEARRLAVQRTVELHEARPDAEIAILVRRKSFIAPLLAMLLQKGCRVSGEGGGLLSDDMAVCVVLSLLHLIDHPSDTAAVFHVGNSPLGQILGFAEQMEVGDVLQNVTALRVEIHDAGLGPTINRWIGRCSSACDTRNFRRLGQLVELAHGYRHDSGGLGAFIDAVKATRVEDQEASKIRVMTVHASKGREFDYVILSDLDGDFLGGGSAGPSILPERGDLLGASNDIFVGIFRNELF